MAALAWASRSSGTSSAARRQGQRPQRRTGRGAVLGDVSHPRDQAHSGSGSRRTPPQRSSYRRRRRIGREEVVRALTVRRADGRRWLDSRRWRRCLISSRTSRQRHSDAGWDGYTRSAVSGARFECRRPAGSSLTALAHRRQAASARRDIRASCRSLSRSTSSPQ